MKNTRLRIRNNLRFLSASPRVVRKVRDRHGTGIYQGGFIIGVVCLVLGVWKRGRGSDWPFLRCRVAIAVESLGGLSSCERIESLAFATGLFAQAKLKGTWELLIRDRKMLVSS